MARMIAAIEADMRSAAAALGKDALDPRVLDAMRTVPREAFVPEDRRAQAYDNAPLPIGFGQTISQPFIVACMTDALALGPETRVLEIGTGCGYQTAVLARLAARVYSVEIVAELAAGARARLAALGFGNVEIRVGDGRDGWPEHAPYDAVMVTAAARELPVALLDQLKPGGRMVLPLGDTLFGQTLVRIEKSPDGAVHRTKLLPVAFVPLVKARKTKAGR
ncbi:MAG: protein-L-isoaspartate(D-aspartate) O-methyltransferase [Alphaproteobacteria bacterium]|nr:protein-L-isoaspartate(D-aspartate) O-methyltransferase [Alphaproteobacteria bacterium]